MAIEPPFRPRLESLLKALYSYDRRPVVKVTDTDASWNSGDAELWSTSGEYNRLARLVLNAHLLRIQVTFTALRNEPGFRIVAVSKGHDPHSPESHHPGLSELIASCYTLGGRPSDLEDLVDLLRRVAPLVHHAGNSADDDGTQKLLQRFDDTLNRYHGKSYP